MCDAVGEKRGRNLNSNTFSNSNPICLGASISYIKGAMSLCSIVPSPLKYGQLPHVAAPLSRETPTDTKIAKEDSAKRPNTHWLDKLVCADEPAVFHWDAQTSGRRQESRRHAIVVKEFCGA